MTESQINTPDQVILHDLSFRYGDLMALALVHDPEIIILDEPESGLDPQSRILVRDYIFNIGAYPFTLQGFMSPTHGVSAMKKVMIMDMGFGDIIPELVWLVLLSLVYFAAGTLLFNKRHMKLNN